MDANPNVLRLTVITFTTHPVCALTCLHNSIASSSHTINFTLDSLTRAKIVSVTYSRKVLKIFEILKTQLTTTYIHIFTDLSHRQGRMLS